MKIVNLIVALAFCVVSLFAQDDPMKAVSEAEMMKAWEEMNALGEEHAMMTKAEGDYSAVQRFYSAPGAPAMESKGKMNIAPLMDGRYQIHNYIGSSFGIPFQGMSISGYDKIKKKYVSTWIDNMGTGIMLFEGDLIDGKIVYFTDYKNPMTGMMEQHKMVTTQTAQGQTMDYYTIDATGKETKSMDVTYTRTSK